LGCRARWVDERYGYITLAISQIERIPNGTKLGFLSYSTIEDGHENSEGFFDRFSDWDCGWVGIMGVRHRTNHLARSSSICLLSADPGCDHRDSDYLASVDRNEFTVIAVKGHLRSEPVNERNRDLSTVDAKG
jgi:hypothetical protein